VVGSAGLGGVGRGATPRRGGGDRHSGGFGVGVVVMGAWVVAVTAVLAFSELVEDVVRSTGLASSDLAAVRALAATREPVSVAVMGLITSLGSPAAMCVVATAVCGWLAWRQRVAEPLLLGAAGVGGIAGLDTATKYMVARPRPPAALHAVVVNGYSFPSGHACFSAVVLPLCCVMAIRWAVRGPWRRLAVCVFSLLGVAAVGFSRVFLGAHYPTDVLGGWALAGAWDAVLVLAVVLVPASGSGFRPETQVYSDGS